MSEHTPGPWTDLLTDSDSDRHMILSGSKIVCSKVNGAANAALIEAAPDLLKACIDVYRYLVVQSPRLSYNGQLSAAIGKATADD